MYSLTSNLETVTNNTSNHGKYWYHEDNKNSNELLITAGDSWTWGEILAPEKRTSQIYGALVSKQLNCDWINVGLPGESNLVIKDYLYNVVKNLKKSYNKINIIFTLTESTRDLVSLEFCKENYNSLKGESWPAFDQLSFNDISIIEREFPNSHIVDIVKMHLAIKDCNTIKSTINAIENTTVSIINQTFAQSTNCILARNFTSWHNIVNATAKNTWTEIIAKRGNLSKYPEDLSFVTSSLGSERLVSYQNQYNRIENFKLDLIDHMDKANYAINWLDSSPYNSNIASKYPLAIGHQWWADYLYDFVH